MIRTHFYTILIFSIVISTSGCTLSSFTQNNFRSYLGHSNISTSPSTVRARSRKVDITSEKFKIMHALQFSVSKYDGISQEEAVIIAQSEIIFRGKETEYHFTKPNVDTEKTNWNLEFFPVSQTFKDSISKPNLLIEVDKKTGNIKWSLIS